MAEKVKLTEPERLLLDACCRCEEGKGMPVTRGQRRIAASLVRNGLAWTIDSIIMVCIATEDGRRALQSEGGE